MNAQTQYEALCEADYQRGFDDGEALAEKIDELLAGEFDPDAAENASEALCEASELQKAAFKAAMRSRDFLLAGEIMYTITHAYFEEIAEERAPAMLEAELERARDEAAADRMAA